MSTMKTTAHYRNLDGWKGYAILWILLGHSVFLYSLDFRNHIGLLLLTASTDFSVDVFFVISGYLIAGRLRTDRQKIDLKTFFLQRALRILPAYVILIALVFGLDIATSPILTRVDSIGPSVPLSYAELGKAFLVGNDGTIPGRKDSYIVSSAYKEAAFWPNFLFIQNYYPLGQRVKMLEHTWFISTIVHFYLVYGLTVYLLYSLFDNSDKRRKALSFLLVAAIALTMLLRTQYGPTYETYWQMTHFRIDAILFGCLLFLNRDLLAPDQSRRWISFLQYGIFSVSFIILVAIVCSWPPINKHIYPFVFFLSYLTIGAMVALSLPNGKISGIFLGNPVVTWLGKYAYGIFLFHYPAMFLYRLVAMRMQWSTSFSLLTFCLAAILAGAGVQYAIESARRRLFFY